MAYTVTFPTAGPDPEIDDLSAWLTERGEPFDQEGPHTLQLRALPVRLRILARDSSFQAHVDITPNVSLTRMVDLLFALSNKAGADVRLAGVGEVTRPDMWVRFADEQDRLRIAQAIERASEQGKKDEVVRGLWAIINALCSGRDVRWDANRLRIVELVDVGEPGGISVEEAAWHMENPTQGDVVPVPIHAQLHTLAWRWLSEAYPNLAINY